MLHSTFYRTIPLQQKKPCVVFDQVKLPHDNKVTAITWHLHCWNPVTMNCHGEVHSQPLIQIDQLLRLLSRSSYWPEKSLLHSFTVRTPCKKCPRVSLISFLVLKGRGWGAKQGGSNFFFPPGIPFLEMAMIGVLTPRSGGYVWSNLITIMTVLWNGEFQFWVCWSLQ